eukprot:1144614-Pelagomonas_calceolata.AAC.11
MDNVERLTWQASLRSTVRVGSGSTKPGVFDTGARIDLTHGTTVLHTSVNSETHARPTGSLTILLYLYLNLQRGQGQRPSAIGSPRAVQAAAQADAGAEQESQTAAEQADSGSTAAALKALQQQEGRLQRV